MKLYQVFLFIIQFTLFQNIRAQTLDLNYLYLQYDLNDEQKLLVEKNITALRAAGTTEAVINQETNNYAFSIMTENQKARFDSIMVINIRNRCKSNYNYLNLTEDQINRMVEMEVKKIQADSSKLTSYYTPIPKDSVLLMLDSTQLSLEAQHQKEFLAHRKSYRAQSDPKKADEAALEAQRLALTKTYYSRYLQKSNRKVLDQIRKSSSEAIIKVDSLTQVYQQRVQLDKAFEISLCYSEDSILLAPNTKQWAEYKYERYQYRPNLCVYWCRLADSTPQTNLEEVAIVQGLEYFKINFSGILHKATKRLKKHRDKFKEELEATWPKLNGTVVTIEPDASIKNVEEVGEILLALPGLQ